jgi:Tol biopolymer transport system component
MALVTTTAACCALTAAARADSAVQPDLAYLSFTKGYWEVWASRADGSEARQLTRSGNDKTRVSWYPDGKALLASCNDGTLLRVDLGGKETRIKLEQFPVVDAVLSPDGKHIAYSFSTAIDGNDLWIARSDGTAAEKVVRMASLQHEPAWTLDATQIYFLSGDGGQGHDIWRVALDGRQTEQITVGSLYHFDVAVSASGALAYSGNRSGNYEVYFQSPGGKPEALTDDPALDGRPAFSPDGTQLVFESTRGGQLNLWRIDLKTRELKQITHREDGARAPAWYHGAVR